MPFCLVCPTGQGRKRGLCVFLLNFSSKFDSDGLITTEPMKGLRRFFTMGKMNAAPLNCKTIRKTAPKNVMIVDLLRNDLGKIAQTGKVRVPEPFKVSRFGSVGR